ncbi:S24 family peptidase [Flavobacterium cerinum]|uniref:LexA family transcriptional regulator n=1 Tax=Flavobacterium cerinum TaxID=2502784 RepID=A0A3S3Q7J5_9FLAO|nr:S24 family peptidase [Flavobacterium cerinum]RWW91833.1 LexA family transcriptional regulator [Flavobacterium cerinum]
MTDKEKILQYLEYKGISKNKFYIKTGLSVGFLDSGSSLGVDKLRLIIDNYHDFNVDWLLSGEGEMIKTKNAENVTNSNSHKNSHILSTEPNIQKNVTVSKDFRLKTDKNRETQVIPLYSMEATAGLVKLLDNIHSQTPIDFISIPNLPNCDGALFVTGDSMYPLLKSGDIIAYKQIHDIENDIFWGEMYLLSIDVGGEELVTIKYVQKSEKEGYIKLVSQNRHHQDKDVKISKIRALAIIKASVRYNVMS